MMFNLGEAFPLELERVRELRAAYREIGPAGTYGLSIIEPLLERAEKAWREQDVVEMLRVYSRMVTFK